MSVTGAAELDGLKTMASWLRGHGHLTRRRRRGSCGRVGRWRTCRPPRRRSPPGAVTAGQVAVIAPIAAEDALAAAAEQGVDLGAIEAVAGGGGRG